jgi:two-component system, cell cycle sensor histidine kinase and response regulator CckA
MGMSDKIKVLICDDTPSLRSAFAAAIHEAGFEAIEAKDGKEGVALALAHHPHVILMDIMMPVLSGHAAVNQIRKDPWGRDAKIIYLTNMDDPENIVRAVEQKTEKYIIKSNTSLEDVIKLVRMTAHT